MGRLARLGILLAATACGRIGYSDLLPLDASAEAGGRPDASLGDAARADGASAATSASASSAASGSTASATTSSSTASGGSASSGSSAGSGSTSGSGTGSGSGSSSSTSGVALSCVANGDGATNCGAAVESCCTSLPVTGGTYERTYVNNGSGPSGLADPASVSSFRLDKYEVTVGRFRRFVAAWNGGAGYLPPAGSGKHTHLNGGRGLVNAGPPPDAGATYEPGWLAANDASVAPTDANLSDAQCDPGSSFATWTPSTGANETRPINCINWYEAYAFCIWDGGFLPSEAEWEYAAAGGAMQLEYPWGTTSPGPGTQYQIYECNYPGGTGCASSANIAPVGTASLGAGPWGQLDLLGNLEEFAVDSSAVPYVNPCVDCAHLTPTTQVIARGGAFSDDVSGLLPPDRNSVLYAYRGDGDGFRCARTP